MSKPQRIHSELYCDAGIDHMLEGWSPLNSDPASTAPLPPRILPPAAANARSSPHVAGWRFRHPYQETVNATALSYVGVTSERGSGGSGVPSG